MKDIVVFALVMATLGQIALCTTVLLVGSVRTRAYLPLAGFFVAVGIVTAGPAVVAFLPAMEAQFIAMVLPALLVLGPAFWLYVEGLTSETPWHFQSRHLRHLVPFGLGVIVTGLLITLPLEEQRAMFIEGEPERAISQLLRKDDQTAPPLGSR